jgi:hypothetical protein
MFGIAFAKRVPVVVLFLGGEPRLQWKYVGTCFRFAVVVKDKEEHHARARWFACGMNRA